MAGRSGASGTGSPHKLARAKICPERGEIQRGYPVALMATIAALGAATLGLAARGLRKTSV
jgi:hypothetical protein